MKGIKLQPLIDDLKLPVLATEGSSGYDLYTTKEIDLYPSEVQTMGLGFKMAIPKGYGALIIPRSGLGSSGLHLANVLGLIDSDYRGEVMVKMKNNSDDVMKFKKHERVFQMVFVQTPTFGEFQVVKTLETTKRKGGFGSTIVGDCE